MMSTKIINRIATPRLSSDRMRTPRSTPLTTENAATEVMPAISSTCICGVLGNPTRYSRPALI